MAAWEGRGLRRGREPYCKCEVSVEGLGGSRGNIGQAHSGFQKGEVGMCRERRE